MQQLRGPWACKGGGSGTVQPACPSSCCCGTAAHSASWQGAPALPTRRRPPFPRSSPSSATGSPSWRVRPATIGGACCCFAWGRCWVEALSSRLGMQRAARVAVCLHDTPHKFSLAQASRTWAHWPAPTPTCGAPTSSASLLGPSSSAGSIPRAACWPAWPSLQVGRGRGHAVLTRRAGRAGGGHGAAGGAVLQARPRSRASLPARASRMHFAPAPGLASCSPSPPPAGAYPKPLLPSPCSPGHAGGAAAALLHQPHRRHGPVRHAARPSGAGGGLGAAAHLAQLCRECAAQVGWVGSETAVGLQGGGASEPVAFS